MTKNLTNPPQDERDKELWLQNAAGYILFRDMKDYAVSNIPINTNDSTKKLIIKGIEDAIYGLMMVMDGVTGTLENDNYRVRIESNIILEKNGVGIEKINTLNGDGMCMGYHEWKDGVFGEEK